MACELSQDDFAFHFNQLDNVKHYFTLYIYVTLTCYLTGAQFPVANESSYTMTTKRTFSILTGSINVTDRDRCAALIDIFKRNTSQLFAEGEVDIVE